MLGVSVARAEVEVGRPALEKLGELQLQLH